MNWCPVDMRTTVCSARFSARCSARFSAVCAMLVVAAVALGAVACGSPHGREPAAGFERMRQQQRYDVYEPAAVFANGTVMQTPPQGTVSREAGSAGSAIRTGATAAGPSHDVPVSMTPALMGTGRTRFQIYCAVCHGAGGFGGSVVASNIWPHPPSLRSRRVREMPAGTIFAVITDGLGRMPSYAPQLSVSERWGVVAYLQSLQGRHPLAPAERADSTYAGVIARDRAPPHMPAVQR